jgi:hypothetical protein
MSSEAPDLLRLSPEELDKLFRSADAGPIPRGEAHGTVLVRPGSDLADPAAKLLHLIAWKGKVFDPDKGELLNEVGPFGWKSVRAKVYKDESWLDGRQSIVLDYSGTSLVAHWIRDEIRLVAPRTYLGIVYWEHTKILDFALEFKA